jgi:outer membrane lipoprotein carrier protein
MRTVTSWLFALLLACLSGQTMASTALDALRDALATLESLQGAFTQKQYSETGELLEQRSGRFAVLRPGFFRWDITHPDSQLIVADPHYLWHFDRDLETVTRRPASSSGQMAPLRVLGGDALALAESFRVEYSAQGAFVLYPQEEGAGFQQVELVLHEGVLSRMNVQDELGQTITIEYFDVDTQTPLTPADFTFTPPAGADLFYYDE